LSSGLYKLTLLCQVGGGDGYPIFSQSGQVDADWHMEQVTIDSEYSSYPFKVSGLATIFE